jgi:hypothetical protein
MVFAVVVTLVEAHAGQTVGAIARASDAPELREFTPSPMVISGRLLVAMLDIVQDVGNRLRGPRIPDGKQDECDKETNQDGCEHNFLVLRSRWEDYRCAFGPEVGPVGAHETVGASDAGWLSFWAGN